MNGPRIQNDDRGITVNKTLAWSMLIGIITGGVFVGSTIAETQSAIESLSREQSQRHTETLTFRRDTETRIRSLEAARATDGSELSALRRDLTSFRQDMNELKDLIRALENSLRQAR